MIKSSKVKEIAITPEMRVKATAKSEEMGKLKNSIRVGEGNVVGFLGEEVVKEFLSTKGQVSGDNTYEYDFRFNGFAVEVKTKETTVRPLSHYECSIANYNPNQKCDFYVFVRVLNDLSKAWILGYAGKEEYFKNATYLKKGDIDVSNNFTVKANCYNLKISDLNNIKDFYE